MAATTSLRLQITVTSAEVLKRKPSRFSARKRLYTVVTLAGSTALSRQRTPVDEHGGTRPYWDFPANFTVDEASARKNRLILVFQLRKRGVFGDKDVGLVYVPVKELLENNGRRNMVQHVAYGMRSRSGKTKGVLYLSYTFVGGGTTRTATPPATWMDNNRRLYQMGNIVAATIPSAPYINESYTYV